VAEDVLRQLFVREVLKELDNQLLNGTGSTNGQMLGLLAASADTGITHTVRGTASRIEEILTAASAVRGADHTGPIHVVLGSSDALALALDLASGSIPLPTLLDLLGIQGFVVSSLVPAGTVLVGDLGTGLSVFLRGGVILALGQSHADFYVRHLVAITAELHAESYVGAPSALKVITGFANA
jgi:hypothetical protein